MEDKTLDVSFFQNLLDLNPSPYHLVNYIESKLIHYFKAKELKLDEKWELGNGSYYVKKEGTSLIAFNVNISKKNEAFLIAGAHTDSPALKLKLDSYEKKSGTVSNYIEVYGGPIISTWLDRNLTLAGIAYYNKNNEIQKELIEIKNIGIIPNLAIHLNKKINDGFSYNTHDNLKVITSSNKTIKETIASKLGINEKDIFSSDLIFTDSDPSKIVGTEEEFLASKNIDNKSGCHAVMNAYVHTENTKNKVAVFFDNEEIGSLSSRGAFSNFLPNVLERINIALGLTQEEHHIKLNKSFMISVDSAHGIHPGYSDKHDVNYETALGKGVAIKNSASFKYSTTASSFAKIKALAKKNNVILQEMIMRADISAGTTIGPISNAVTGIESIDIGTPIWAMHSLKETVSIFDHVETIKLLRSFFEQGS